MLETLTPQKSRAINREAFEAGRAWAKAARSDPSLRFDADFAAHVKHAEPADVSVKLDINAAWCKGCDICVKLCPERCLALNDHQVAYLKSAGGLHRLPRVRMALPRLRHRRPHHDLANP